MKKKNYWRQRNTQFLIQDFLICIISRSTLFYPKSGAGQAEMVSGRLLHRISFIKIRIVNLPKRAAYVTDPAELIFDTGLDIVPQYEHIFEETENCQRLPETIRGSVMKVQLFDGALRQTKRMLEADYRTAIPQYYNHGIQFLIPVCLQNPDRADLALACVKTEDGSKYLGRTCLTLKMAYHNARLLAKIHSSWLYP